MKELLDLKDLTIHDVQSIRSQIHLGSHPFWKSVKVNPRAEIGRFGLVVRVGGAQGISLSETISSPELFGMEDCSQVDNPGSRYKSVNFRVRK